MNLIKKIHISEKATRLKTDHNQYIFEVDSRANKPELQKEVEKEFKVDVEKINIVNTPSKPRRRGRFVGKKAGFKKAIVKLQSGQKINPKKIES